MSIDKVEGIVLHAIPFQDYDQIATVFTRNLGCIKVVVKEGYRTHSSRLVVLGPLIKAQFLLQESKSELYRCSSLYPVNLYPEIRQQLPLLHIGCTLLQGIRFSQYPGLAAEDLYNLLTILLDRLPHAPTPEMLIPFFYIKIWKHEGILNLDLFSDSERALILQLANCRSIEELWQISINQPLTLKIKRLFFH